LAGEIDRFGIHIHHHIPMFLGDIEWKSNTLNCRIIYQHIAALKLRQCRLKHLLAISSTGHIDLQGQRFATKGLNFLRDRFSLVATNVSNLSLDTTPAYPSSHTYRLPGRTRTF
jgi:hypothetical protein